MGQRGEDGEGDKRRQKRNRGDNGTVERGVSECQQRRRGRE